MSYFLNLPSRSSSLLGQLTPYKLVFLFIGLALWVFLPIVGIFPLLFFIQLNIINKNAAKESREPTVVEWLANVLKRNYESYSFRSI